LLLRGREAIDLKRSPHPVLQPILRGFCTKMVSPIPELVGLIDARRQHKNPCSQFRYPDLPITVLVLPGAARMTILPVATRTASGVDPVLVLLVILLMAAAVCAELATLSASGGYEAQDNE